MTSGNRLTIKEIVSLPDEEALEYLRRHPMRGGAPEDDEPEDEPEDQEQNGDPDDTGGSGSKDRSKDGKGGKGDKTYTKAELDAIVETVVKERLARKERSDARKKAEQDGDKDKLIEDLRKEIDEDLKPTVGRVKELEEENEGLKAVVDQQIESILDDLPEDLRDLDLGEDVGPVRRLEWLLEKVVPKKGVVAGSGRQEEKPKPGNGPNPRPHKDKGGDPETVLKPIVGKKRF